MRLLITALGINDELREALTGLFLVEFLCITSRIKTIAVLIRVDYVLSGYTCSHHTDFGDNWYPPGDSRLDLSGPHTALLSVLQDLGELHPACHSRKIDSTYRPCLQGSRVEILIGFVVKVGGAVFQFPRGERLFLCAQWRRKFLLGIISESLFRPWLPQG